MLLAFPSDDVIWDATLSSSQEDSDYPVANAQNNKTDDTAKSTSGTAFTIEVDLAAPVTVVAAFVGNTNATGGSLISDGGTIGSFTFPSRTPDGKQRNGWLDTRALPHVTDDHFEFVLSKSGSPKLEVGRLCLVVELQAPEVLVEGAGSPPVSSRMRPGQVENVSRGGTTWRRPVPWAPIRSLTISTLTADARAILDQLEAESNGLDRGFLFIENEDENDAWFAQCEFVPFEFSKNQPDDVAEIEPVRMKIVEIAMGLPPALT